MTFQDQFIRQGIKEQGKGGNHEHSDYLSYTLKAAQHINARNRGFAEAYRNAELRLELNFRSVNYEVGRECRKDPAVAYGFSGLIGPEHSTACVNEFPDKRSIQRGECEHMVLVAVREIVEIHQGVRGDQLGLHMIRLEPVYSSDCPLMNSIEPTFLQGLGECILVGANREQILERGCVAVSSHEFVDDVVQRRSEVVDNVPSDGGKCERWLLSYLEPESPFSAVACITLGQYRYIRSFVHVKQGLGMEPVKVTVRIS